MTDRKVGKPFDVAIADPLELSRVGLGLAIEHSLHWRLALEARDAHSLLQYCMVQLPAVVVLNLELPDYDAQELVSLLVQNWPDIKILVLTGPRDPQGLYELLASGVLGICARNISVDAFLRALESVREGSTYLDRHLGTELLQFVTDVVVMPVPGLLTDLERAVELTTRENEVLFFLSKGKSNKEISLLLQITCHTVKVHVCNIIQKLNVSNRRQAVMKAMELGLLSDSADVHSVFMISD